MNLQWFEEKMIKKLALIKINELQDIHVFVKSLYKILISFIHVLIEIDKTFHLYRCFVYKNIFWQ